MSGRGASLQGQVVIVTGASRGLGRSYAHALVRAGADVVAMARSREGLADMIDALGGASGSVTSEVVDITDPAGTEAAVDRTLERFGRIDVLVNNAGIVGPIGMTHTIDPDAWWRNCEVNLLGAFLMSRHVVPVMGVQARGTVINVVSAAGGRALPNVSAYSVSKTALLRLTETMAAELAETDVRILAFDPGPVMTDLTKSVLETPGSREWLPWFGELFESGVHRVDRRALRPPAPLRISGNRRPLATTPASTSS